MFCLTWSRSFLVGFVLGNVINTKVLQAGLGSQKFLEFSRSDGFSYQWLQYIIFARQVKLDWQGRTAETITAEQSALSA